jgi:flagellar biosynthetic protein FliP
VTRSRAGALAVLLAVGGWLLAGVTFAPAAAAEMAEVMAVPAPPVPPGEPAEPVAPVAPDGDAQDGSTTVQLNVDGEPSTAVVVLLGITVLSVAPSLLLLTTSFTKIIVVLSLTRNALGLTNTPPAQVLTGLALFLSLFVMAPVVGAVNEVGVQPYLSGEKTLSVAASDGLRPLREFMLDHTRDEELALFLQVAGEDAPASRADVPLPTLVPAFLISELKSAFIIGFVIFLPFLVIDLVVSAVLMSMGMMMLPPVLISLPFKLLLFVLVDGWSLIVEALVGSYTLGGVP